MINIEVILRALVFVGLLFFGACQKSESVTHLKGRTMGTNYNVKYIGGDLDLQKSIDQLLENVNKEMSTYILSSEISYFNNSARLSWVSISKDFFNVTNYAIALASETQGAYDPTIGPLVNLWGFGPNSKREVPSESAIAEAKAKVGFKKIELDRKGYRIRKKVPGIYLDLSSVAKGFGVDKIAHFLESQGISRFMVEIGGEVRVKGKNAHGALWRIAIESPQSQMGSMDLSRVLDLSNTSLATSGNYRNFFLKEGKKYSHTISSRTGRPVPNELGSVSVVDPRGCMQADALATALMVMGLDKALKFANEKQIAAYFIYMKDGPTGQAFASVESSKFKTLFPKVDK